MLFLDSVCVVIISFILFKYVDEFRWFFDMVVIESVFVKLLLGNGVGWLFGVLLKVMLWVLFLVFIYCI